MKTAHMTESQEFLTFLKEWTAGLPRLELKEAVRQAENTALVSVDVINGFCKAGPLASPRVARIAAPVAGLMQRAWEAGVRHILLTQDTHDPDAVEFGSWPAHCVRGTAEAQAVDEIRALPFYDHMVTIEKNSIASQMNTGLAAWVEAHPQVDTYLVVGDCTDLCVYQLAMYLRLDANARQIQRRVIVPVDCVDTYDYPLAAARENGGLPHPGGLLHEVFLYHMALNGVEVVAGIG